MEGFSMDGSDENVDYAKVLVFISENRLHQVGETANKVRKKLEAEGKLKDLDAPKENGESKEKKDEKVDENGEAEKKPNKMSNLFKLYSRTILMTRKKNDPKKDQEEQKKGDEDAKEDAGKEKTAEAEKQTENGKKEKDAAESQNESKPSTEDITSQTKPSPDATSQPDPQKVKQNLNDNKPSSPSEESKEPAENGEANTKPINKMKTFGSILRFFSKPPPKIDKSDLLPEQDNASEGQNEEVDKVNPTHDDKNSTNDKPPKPIDKSIPIIDGDESVESPISTDVEKNKSVNESSKNEGPKTGKEKQKDGVTSDFKSDNKENEKTTSKSKNQEATKDEKVNADNKSDNKVRNVAEVGQNVTNPEQRLNSITGTTDSASNEKGAHIEEYVPDGFGENDDSHLGTPDKPEDKDTAKNKLNADSLSPKLRENSTDKVKDEEEDTKTIADSLGDEAMVPSLDDVTTTDYSSMLPEFDMEKPIAEKNKETPTDINAKLKLPAESNKTIDKNQLGQQANESSPGQNDKTSPIKDEANNIQAANANEKSLKNETKMTENKDLKFDVPTKDGDSIGEKDNAKSSNDLLDKQAKETFATKPLDSEGKLPKEVGESAKETGKPGDHLEVPSSDVKSGKESEKESTTDGKEKIRPRIVVPGKSQEKAKDADKKGSNKMKIPEKQKLRDGVKPSESDKLKDSAKMKSIDKLKSSESKKVKVSEKPQIMENPKDSGKRKSSVNFEKVSERKLSVKDKNLQNKTIVKEPKVESSRRRSSVTNKRKPDGDDKKDKNAEGQDTKDYHGATVGSIDEKEEEEDDTYCKEPVEEDMITPCRRHKKEIKDIVEVDNTLVIHTQVSVTSDEYEELPEKDSEQTDQAKKTSGKVSSKLDSMSPKSSGVPIQSDPKAKTADAKSQKTAEKSKTAGTSLRRHSSQDRKAPIPKTHPSSGTIKSSEKIRHRSVSLSNKSEDKKGKFSPNASKDEKTTSNSIVSRPLRLKESRTRSGDGQETDMKDNFFGGNISDSDLGKDDEWFDTKSYTSTDWYDAKSHVSSSEYYQDDDNNFFKSQYSEVKQNQSPFVDPRSKFVDPLENRTISGLRNSRIPIPTKNHLYATTDYFPETELRTRSVSNLSKTADKQEHFRSRSKSPLKSREEKSFSNVAKETRKRPPVKTLVHKPLDVKQKDFSNVSHLKMDKQVQAQKAIKPSHPRKEISHPYRGKSSQKFSHDRLDDPNSKLYRSEQQLPPFRVPEDKKKPNHSAEILEKKPKIVVMRSGKRSSRSPSRTPKKYKKFSPPPPSSFHRNKRTFNEPHDGARLSHNDLTDDSNDSRLDSRNFCRQHLSPSRCTCLSRSADDLLDFSNSSSILKLTFVPPNRKPTWKL